MTAVQVDQLVWLCDVCEESIEDGDGWVTVNTAAAYAARREHDAFDARHGGYPVGMWLIMNLPQRVPWKAFHKACDPDPEKMSYWFDIERIRTVADALSWTLHLSEKNWVRHTDWASLMRRAVLPQSRAA